MKSPRCAAGRWPAPHFPPAAWPWPRANESCRRSWIRSKWNWHGSDYRAKSSRSYNSDIGLVGKTAGKYTIYLGGRLLGDRLNTIYKDLIPEEEVVSTLMPVFAYFKHARNPGETLGDFCHRKGMADIQAWTEQFATPLPA